MYIVWIFLIAVIFGGIAYFLFNLANTNYNYADKCQDSDTAEKYNKWGDQNRIQGLVAVIIGVLIIILIIIW